MADIFVLPPGILSPSDLKRICFVPDSYLLRSCFVPMETKVKRSKTLPGKAERAGDGEEPPKPGKGVHEALRRG